MYRERNLLEMTKRSLDKELARKAEEAKKDKKITEEEKKKAEEEKKKNAELMTSFFSILGVNILGGLIGMLFGS